MNRERRKNAIQALMRGLGYDERKSTRIVDDALAQIDDSRLEDGDVVAGIDLMSESGPERIFLT